MSNLSELNNLIKSWIEDYQQSNFDRTGYFRREFERLEKAEFGMVSERIKNPLAMLYNKIRNALIRYSGDKNPKDLELAVTSFSQIKT